MFGEVLDRFRGSTTRIMIIEDLHWADETMLELLRFLANRIATLPVLILVSFRDEQSGPLDPLRLLVGDLTAAGCVERLALRRSRSAR